MNKGRKVSGGKYHANRKKRFFEKQSQEIHVLLGETRSKMKRGRGGHKDNVLLRAKDVNIIVNGKSKKAEIKNVIETPQNKFLARQNRLMKGVIVETTLGKARITNRPGREGMINAVLVKD